jgi:hypothetical protein
MSDGCVDSVDVNAKWEERSQFDKSKGPIAVVYDDVELLGREKRCLGAELAETVSIDEHPISLSSSGIRKHPPVRISRVVYPVTAVGKGLSRNHC